MTRIAIAFSAAAFATVGLIGNLHAQTTFQKGARDGKAEKDGYRVRGCAFHDFNYTGYGLKQVCNEYSAVGYHQRFKDISGSPPK